MRLTERTDLALRLLLYLTVQDADIHVPVATIAGAFRSSEAHLAKVCQALAHAGFVDTTPGRAGGARLARAATEIRIGEVVRALEPVALADCFSTTGDCAIQGVCGLEHALRSARDAFLAELDAVTLAQVSTKRAALRARLAIHV